MEARPDISRPPIPEPYESAAASEAKFFRSFRLIYLNALTWGLPVPLLLILPFKPARISWETHLIGLAFACVVGTLAGAVATGLMCALLPVGVSAIGLRSQGTWGLSRSLSWAEPVRIRPRRVLSLRYLMLRSERGGTIRLPLFLSDMDGFKAAVHQHAPPNHPLRQALGLPP